MYCRFCGKQIEEDSLLCKYCGSNLGYTTDRENITFSAQKDWLKRFQTLPIKKQILLIAYIVYFLIWICVLIDTLDWDYDIREMTISFIICAFIFPFVAVCGYYYWKKYKRYKSERARIEPSSTQESNKADIKDIVETKQEAVPSVASENSVEVKIRRTPIQTEPLLSFAKSHGKMQVVKKTDNSSNTPQYYCLFESCDGSSVKVEFAEELGVLNAEEISRRKYELFVNFYGEGIYELAVVDRPKDDCDLPF